MTAVMDHANTGAAALVPGTQALLEVRGLQAGYGDVQVLWAIDFTGPAGQIACVVGSNGAGARPRYCAPWRSCLSASRMPLS